MHLADEMLKHFLGYGKIRNHAVFHRPDGDDVAGRAPEHALGLHAHGGDALGAAGTAFLANGDHRGFVEHDALAAYINESVGSTQIDGYVVGKQTAKAIKHNFL